MSVVKSKRNKSKEDFEALYFKVADGVDTLVEHNFYANHEQLEKNKTFLDIRCTTLEKLTDDLLYNIKIANSIYPTCIAELDVLNCYKSWRGVVIVDHNAYYKTICSMDKLYYSLFPNKVQNVRKSRNKLCTDIYIDANKNDFKYILS